MKSYAVIAVVLALLEVNTFVQSLSVCPANAKRFGNMCYSLNRRSTTWLDANNKCKLLGGQLATIDALPVNNFLFNNYRQQRQRSSNVWIGFKKCNDKWCHPDGKASVFHKWNTKEPNNVGGNEDCVEMWHNGYWNDAPCNQRRQSICEIPVLVDECALGTANCHYQAICTNTMRSYTCACKAGFTGNGTVCNDIDECSSGVNSCNALANCENTFGSYSCTCHVGYHGDGKKCTKVSVEHDKILKELEEHDKLTDKKLTNIENLLQKLLG
ncbi:Aggrecan core [Paramuricea clavata]|uniref:Aggrecan core n=1 Tax=Paramuricea clavata TaxID=317549 RepID=A0A6S7G6T8_PARCT|nr:Aggrecan core [Paramuricea clavata]